MGLEESKVIYLHTKPKFVDRWAKRFVTIYRTKGRDDAVAWAMSFLDREAIKPVSERAKQLLGKV